MTWLIIVLLGAAGVFGSTAWAGWKTGIARLPLSLFAIEEFERGRSVHFWPLTVLNAVVSILALAAAAFTGWSVWGVPSRPIDTPAPGDP